MARFLLVYNPRAGNGKAGKALEKTRAICAEIGLAVDVHLTDRQGHGEHLARTADFGEYDGIIAGGGDGTCFEVVNGCFEPCVSLLDLRKPGLQ